MERENLVSADHSLSVATSSVKVLRKNPDRVWASFVNVGTNDIYLQLGKDAAQYEGVPLLTEGASFIIDKNNPWFGEVTGIAITAATNLAVIEVEKER